MVKSLFVKVWNNHNRTVFLLRGGWYSLDLDMCGLVWPLMVTLVEEDDQ